MDLQINGATVLPEIKRLNAILPMALRSQIGIKESKHHQSGLIEVTRSKQQHQFWIQVDLHRWQNLDQHQRNMLFWHEVAQIQRQLLQRQLFYIFSPEKLILAIGSVVFLLEILSQNLLGLSTTLSVMGLALYQLYQHSYGENSIRSATNADQSAIRLATEFGYSPAFAAASLLSALTVLTCQCRQKSSPKTSNLKTHPNNYHVRLRVLEILQPSDDFAASNKTVFP